MPLSIQQCYENFFNFAVSDGDDPSSTQISIGDYNIYSNLVNLGFIVRRAANQSNETNSQVKTSADDQTNLELVQNQPIINRSEHGK